MGRPKRFQCSYVFLVQRLHPLDYIEDSQRTSCYGCHKALEVIRRVAGKQANVSYSEMTPEDFVTFEEKIDRL